MSGIPTSLNDTAPIPESPQLPEEIVRMYENTLLPTPKGLTDPSEIVKAAIVELYLPPEFTEQMSKGQEILDILGYPITEEGITQHANETDYAVQSCMMTLGGITFTPLFVDLSEDLPRGRQNCFSLVCTAAKCALELGIPTENLRTYHVGGHIGLMYFLPNVDFANSVRVYDPFPNVYTLVERIPEKKVLENDVFLIIRDNPMMASQMLIDTHGLSHLLGRSQEVRAYYNYTITFNYLIDGLVAEAAFLVGHHFYEGVATKEKIEKAQALFQVALNYDPFNPRTSTLVKHCERLLNNDF